MPQSQAPPCTQSKPSFLRLIRLVLKLISGHTHKVKLSASQYSIIGRYVEKLGEAIRAIASFWGDSAVIYNVATVCSECQKQWITFRKLLSTEAKMISHFFCDRVTMHMVNGHTPNHDLEVMSTWYPQENNFRPAITYDHLGEKTCTHTHTLCF